MCQIKGKGKRILVKVPATSANLGPGYDCMGAALSLYSEFLFEPAEKLLIEGCPLEYQNENNLTIQAFKAACEEAGEAAFPVHLSVRAGVPVSRGLGSSSTCIVAGVLAANAFLGEPLSKEALLALCTRLEGHPDNVAPCLFGGVVAGFETEGKTYAVSFPAAEDWRFVVLIPDYEVRTHEARKAVKQDIDVKTSVYTTGHALAFVKALSEGDEALMGLAARDILHEPYRKALIPDYKKAKACSLRNGAAAFLISGSGSTMLALCKGEEKAALVAAALTDAFPAFMVKSLRLCHGGAEVRML